MNIVCGYNHNLFSFFKKKGGESVNGNAKNFDFPIKYPRRGPSKLVKFLSSFCRVVFLVGRILLYPLYPGPDNKKINSAKEISK